MGNKIKFAFFACILLFSNAAFAGAIVGSIDFYGQGTSSAEGVDLQAVVTGTSGSFTGVPNWSFVNMDGDTLSWNVGGFSYTSADWWFENIQSDLLVIRGSGMLEGNGYASTVAKLLISVMPLGNTVFDEQDGKPNGAFQFIARTAVPEPTTLALLGIGLLAFGVVRYTKNRNKV